MILINSAPRKPRQIIKFCFFILTVFLLPNSAYAKQEKKLPKKLSDFIENIELKKIDFQGGSIAILHKGEVVYKTVFGDKKNNLGPIKPTTLFPLASVSKPVFAIALGLLADKHHLNLDEKILLPWLKSKVSFIDILSHTTGYKFEGDIYIEQGLSRKELLNIIKGKKPQCKPGKCYRYSNLMFSLLEDALHYKKLSLKDVMQNMRSTLKIDTVELMPLSERAEVAYPHSKKLNDSGLEKTVALPFPPYYPKNVPAAAGVFASIDSMIELFKLGFGYRPDLISPATLKKIYTPITPTNDTLLKWDIKWPVEKKSLKPYYALGWRVIKVKNKPNNDLIFHSGHINGINSFIGFVPSEELGIIILLNQKSPFPIRTGIDFWGKSFESDSE